MAAGSWQESPENSSDDDQGYFHDRVNHLPHWQEIGLGDTGLLGQSNIPPAKVTRTNRSLQQLRSASDPLNQERKVADDSPLHFN